MAVQPLEAFRNVLSAGLDFSNQGFSRDIFIGAWIGHLRDAGTAAAIIFSALGTGVRISAWLSSGREISAVARVGVGLGILGMGMLGLGLTGLVFLPVAGIAVIAGAVLSLPFLVEMVSGLRGAGRSFIGGFQGIEGRILLFSLAVMGISCVLTAMGPEGGWDAVFYHMRLPKLYALAHKVGFISNIYPSNYPQGLEMIYLLGWLAGGEGSAKMVNLLFWFLSGGAVWRLSRHFGAGISARAAALALTMPISGALASEGYIDLGLTFLELTAIGEVIRGRNGTAGFLLGCAMASKYTGVFAFASALAAGWSLGIRPGRMVLMAAVAIIPLAPWLAKNAWFTGDPCAPFLSGFLGKLDWVDGISQAPLKTVHGLMPSTVGGAGATVLTGLWKFLNNNVFGVLTPFVIGFLPALAWRSGSPVERAWKVYGLAFTALVLLFAPDGRYWQPALFALCIPMAIAWTRLSAESMGQRLFVGGFAVFSVLAGSLYHPAEMNRSLPGTWSVALGISSRDSFYGKHRAPDGYWEAVSFINGYVPAGERVGVISDVQAYLIDRGTFFDSDAIDSRRWVDNLALICRSPGDWERAFCKWKCRTVLYIYGRASAVGHPRDWTSGETRVFAEFWKKNVRRVFRSADCSVYALGLPGESRAMPDLPGPQERWLLEMQAASRWPGECKKVYTAVLASGADTGRVSLIYGGLMANAGAIAESSLALERAVMLAPDEATAWYWLTSVRIRKGDRTGARKSFEKAFEIEPENALSTILGNAVR